ncbi:hypothetical protein C0J52_28404 [Blattella germanica]|nr:hypothetical protein C0J52_28404 [Blattella germanica]
MVVIHVNDVNDLPPVFNSTLYTGLMEEEFAGPHPYRLLQVLWFPSLVEGISHKNPEEIPTVIPMEFNSIHELKLN